MKNTMTNYTNAERVEFIKQAFNENKRIEKYNDTLYALSEDEFVAENKIENKNEEEK
jgi:hypothetical protein